MSLLHSTAVIANGASQSGVLDLTERVIVSIHLPDAWTAAAITLLAAETEAGDYSPVHDTSGEVSFTVAAEQVLVIDPNVTRGLRYVKLRSGNTATPVNQGAERTLSVGTVQDDRA